MISGSLSLLFDDFPIVNLILDVEWFLGCSILPTLFGYQAVHLGSAIGCCRVGPKIALQALNCELRKLLFRALRVNYILGV